MKTTMQKNVTSKGDMAILSFLDKRPFHSFEADKRLDAIKRPIRQTTVIMPTSETPKLANVLIADIVVLSVLVVLKVLLLLNVLIIDESNCSSSSQPKFGLLLEIS